MLNRKCMGELSFGDIVTIRAPFEENTPDFYNGYTVDEVLGSPVTDRRGNTYKNRPVMVIGMADSKLAYIPLTSSTGNKHDNFYQYHILDNSMTPKRDDSIQTYVEFGSVRVIEARESWSLFYHGKLTELDINNIKDHLNKDSLSVKDGYDKRVYMNKQTQSLFGDRLLKHGFELNQHDDIKTYTLGNREYTIYPNDTVLYHHQTPLDVIQSRHASLGDSLNNLQRERENPNI